MSDLKNMQRNEEWEDLFRKWFGRLIIDPGWTLTFAPDEHLDWPASYTVIRPHRQMVIRYRPTHQPSDEIACHEVCHLFITQVEHAALNATDELSAPADQIARKAIKDAAEQAADDLARAFLRAYGETDG